MKLFFFALVFAPLFLFAAVSQKSAYTPDAAWKAPPEAAARKNPLADNPDAVRGGRKLFLRNCSECHGKDGRGCERAPDLHLEVVQKQSGGELFWKITNGNSGRGMPAWSRLPEAQRWQLVLFLRTLPRDSVQ